MSRSFSLMLCECPGSAAALPDEEKRMRYSPAVLAGSSREDRVRFLT